MKFAQDTKDTVLLTPQAVTAGATVSGQLDTAGGDYSTIRFLVNLGATATLASANGVSVSLSTADVTNSTAFATISGTALTGIKKSQEVLYQTNMIGKQRYVQLNVTTGTNAVTNEAATVSAVGSVSLLEQIPTAGPGMVTGTNDQVVIS
jgi:hypothetical protein